MENDIKSRYFFHFFLLIKFLLYINGRHKFIHKRKNKFISKNPKKTNHVVHHWKLKMIEIVWFHGSFPIFNQRIEHIYPIFYAHLISATIFIRTISIWWNISILKQKRKKKFKMKNMK